MHSLIFASFIKLFPSFQYMHHLFKYSILFFTFSKSLWGWWEGHSSMVGFFFLMIFFSLLFLSLFNKKLYSVVARLKKPWDAQVILVTPTFPTFPVDVSPGHSPPSTRVVWYQFSGPSSYCRSCTQTGHGVWKQRSSGNYWRYVCVYRMNHFGIFENTYSQTIDHWFYVLSI